MGVEVEVLGQLSYRPVALDGGKRHLRLESRAVVPARSSVHGLSCSRRSSPLSGRNSTYRPVQICGAGSDLCQESDAPAITAMKSRRLMLPPCAIDA